MNSADSALVKHSAPHDLESHVKRTFKLLASPAPIASLEPDPAVDCEPVAPAPTHWSPHPYVIPPRLHAANYRLAHGTSSALYALTRELPA